MAGGDLTSSFKEKANYMTNWKPASVPSVRCLLIVDFAMIVHIHTSCSA
jgi:hypothetical protein